MPKGTPEAEFRERLVHHAANLPPQQQAIADYFLHPVFDRVTPDVLDDIPRLRAAGCNTIKFFTVFQS